MEFEKSIREDFSEVPLLFYLGGKGTRMENLPYKQIVPTKAWLPVTFDENTEPIPSFWPLFEVFLELGFKEIYVIVNKGDGEKSKKYFGKKLKTKDVNVQFIDAENFSKRLKINGVNIYICENELNGTGSPIIEIEEAINNRAFVRVFGDNYFGYKKEKKEEFKEDIKKFLVFGLKKAEEGITTAVFVPIEKVVSVSKEEEALSKFSIDNYGKINLLKERGKIVITSITIEPPSIIKMLKEMKENLDPLDIHSKFIRETLIREGKFYGKVINGIDFFLNANTPEDYHKLVSLINIKTEKENNAKENTKIY
jgi:dTDP-glucose pyrophosphorylase